MKKKTKNILLALVVLGLIGGGVLTYLIRKKLEPTADYVRYCHNAHLIHEELVEFNEDYLELPSAEALSDDPEAKELDFSTSNGYLGALIVAAAKDSEEIFFIAESSCCKGDAPDNVVIPRKNVLKAGENGWAYFKGRELEKDASQPLLAPGWNPETKEWDETIWKNNGIPVLKVDGSVTLYAAPKDGKDEEFETTTAALPFEKSDPALVQPAH